MVRLHGIDVLAADVEFRQQRQGDSTTLGVSSQGGEADPDVAIQELLAGGSRVGVVVQASPFDLGTPATGRRVVQGQTQPTRGDDRLDGAEDGNGHRVGTATAGSDGVVGGTELDGDAGGAEPGGNGATSGGEEDADADEGDADGGASVQTAVHTL